MPARERAMPFNADAVINAIVAWLSDYCDEAAQRGFVVGVSGGIDSAVTAALCARTGKTTLLLNMPIQQAPAQFELSTRHIEALTGRHPNAEALATDLTPVFKALSETLPEAIQDPLTMANARARLRMLTLYAFAGHRQCLVAGTGNKVEDFGVGFFTKYGDGGVDISPIADLTKTQVYALGRALDVNEAILAAPPTDGLWADNRTDEDQIGASYEELEWAMTVPPGTTELPGMTERQREVLGIYRRLHAANQHKMAAIPVFKLPEDLS